MKLSINKTTAAYFCLFFLIISSGIKAGSLYIPFFFIIEGLLLSYLLFFNKTFVKDMHILLKKTPFLYIFLFLIWAGITVIISIIKGSFYLKSFVFSFVGGLIFSVIFPIIVSFILNKKFLNTKNFIHFYLAICLFIYSLGLLEFIIRNINLDIANYIMVFFNNKRHLLLSNDSSAMLVSRIKSIFDEPSNLGEFIYLNIPIIYSLSFSKYKIFKNEYLNKLTKISLVFLCFINLILSKSPISLVIVLIISLLYFWKPLILKFKKHTMFYVTIFIVSIIIIFFICQIILNYYSISLQETYLKRIIDAVPALLSLDKLIENEPSLATRIINYTNNLQVFFHNMGFGVGYGNISNYILIQMKQSSLPMTNELWQVLQNETTGIASAIFYRVLAETGIIGYILLFFFMFKTYKQNKVLINMSMGLEKDFLNGINYYLIVFMTIVCLYNSNLHNAYYWLIFGFIFAYKTKISRVIKTNKTD